MDIKVIPFDQQKTQGSDYLLPDLKGSQLMPTEFIGKNTFAIGIKVCVFWLLSVDMPNQTFKAKMMVMLRYRAQPAPDGYFDVIEYHGKNYRKMQLPIMNTLNSETNSETVEIASELEFESQISKDGSSRKLPLVEVLWIISATFRMSASLNVVDFPMDAHNLVITIFVMPSQPMAKDHFFAEIMDGYMNTLAMNRVTIRDPVSHNFSPG